MLPGDVCVAYNVTNQLYILSPCGDSTTTCPNPSIWGDAVEVKCIDWDTRKAFSSDTYEDYYDEILLTEIDAQCDEHQVADICDYNNGLVCQCVNNNCTCQQGQEPEAPCNDTSLCIPGYVCANSTCVEMYSLVPGTPSKTALACQGGGPLISNFFSSTCRATSMTVGGVPRACNSSIDCAGTDGSYTECVCGLTDPGTGYCKLHFNDDPMVKYRHALSNYLFTEMVYYSFMVNNYPYFQGAVPSCLRNVWRDYGEFRRELSTALWVTIIIWGLIG